MNELTEKLWPSFQAEVSEQLDAIELALVSDDVEAIDVDALFRQFHTVKGGCAMMGFAGMEAVAHAAEDLLVPVRKGTQPLDSQRIELLLGALDGLKAQMESAEQSRQDPAARPDLVARLREFCDAGNVAENASPQTKRTAVEADEPLQRFADTCAAILPMLMVAALESAQAAEQHLLTLQQAALGADIPALASMLSRPAASSDNAAQRRRLFADLLDRISWLERTYELECGVTEAAMALRMQPPTQLMQALEEIPGLLDKVGAKPSAQRSKTLASLQVHANTLLDEALLRQWPASSRITRLSRQTLREISRRNAVLNDELKQILTISMTLCLELEPADSETETYQSMAEQCQQRLQQLSLHLDEHTDTRQVDQLSAQLELEPEWLENLGDKVHARLQQAVDLGQLIALIDADLEAISDHGEGFISWLSQKNGLLHSDTLFDGDAHRSTRLRLLVALPVSADALSRTLSEFDPEGHFFEVRLLGKQTAELSPETRTTSAAKSTAGSTLRIDSATLDQFVNRVGEMVMLRNLLAHLIDDDSLNQRRRRMQNLLSQRSQKRPPSDEDLDELRALLRETEQREVQLTQADQRLQTTLERMQDDALALRVVPIGMVFNRLPRVVRDVSQAQGKQVSLKTSGDDVRIDKSLLEILIEPLMHMVRNAVDHGIEHTEQRKQAGKPALSELHLSARQSGNSLLVEMRDDGRGLDCEKIRQRALKNGLATEAALTAMDERELFNLIFLPGFSTSEQVTEVSGRGVGMDVVKTRVLQVGGQIEVQSRPGRGTTFILKLPLSAAIQSVILVAAGDHRIALPERNVSEVINIQRDSLQTIQGQACAVLRDIALPVYRLDLLLGYHQKEAGADNQQLEIAVLSDGMYRIGLVVDRVLGRPEIFVRDVHPDITALAGVGGISVLADGGLVIIADCEKLFELALRNAQSLRSLVRAS